MYTSVLERGDALHYHLNPNRYAWLQVAQGVVSLNDQELRLVLILVQKFCCLILHNLRKCEPRKLCFGVSYPSPRSIFMR
ncbi:hypothetical protein [Gloeocapsopsis sp. IPPAS B-1203]|uniref:pirin family protein n=1 Tax=Gloeocapsopsis sp. IPPAS B-1203 TaxID=2049454 RepID=UPI0025A2D820|nr:hypothetical protein [Gloeocapsopsis sp. IPPAS B-1203]